MKLTEQDKAMIKKAVINYIHTERYQLPAEKYLVFVERYQDLLNRLDQGNKSDIRAKRKREIFDIRSDWFSFTRRRQ